MTKKILVWDVPTRVFHWLQALSFLGAYLTADSEKTREIHVTLGFILFGLIAFRLVWGFVGTKHARFSSFIFHPSTVITYVRALLKNNAQHFVGHNPIGSIAIWLLLGMGIGLGVTGVMLLQDDVADSVVEIHAYLTNGMLVVIAGHLVGVAMSSFLHKENLVRAMITGHKKGSEQHGITQAYAWLGAALVVAAAVFAYLYNR
ncbi:MAG: cytochrome b/b6 domain-containing protein [Gallionella sp.]